MVTGTLANKSSNAVSTGCKIQALYKVNCFTSCSSSFVHVRILLNVCETASTHETPIKKKRSHVSLTGFQHYSKYCFSFQSLNLPLCISTEPVRTNSLPHIAAAPRGTLLTQECRGTLACLFTIYTTTVTICTPRHAPDWGKVRAPKKKSSLEAALQTRAVNVPP